MDRDAIGGNMDNDLKDLQVPEQFKRTKEKMDRLAAIVAGQLSHDGKKKETPQGE